MILLATDPGSFTSGWARLETRGGAGDPVSATFISGGEVESTCEALERLLLSPVDLVVVEKIAGIAYAPKGGGIVSALIASSSVAGGIAWMARALKLRVLELTAREWRGIVLGLPNASDAKIKEMIPRLVHGFPARSNVHVRDAAGCGLAAAWQLAGRRGAA